MRRTMFLLGCLMLTFQVAFAQMTISGKVTDATNGEGIPGVQIIAKGTTSGGTTDVNGNYSISVPSNTNVLVFSFMGYKAQEVTIGGRNVINVVLESDLISLEETVVVGYGVQRKREVTGAISQVKGADISTLATPSFESQLAGRSPGVQITTTTGVIGVAPRIRIRGIGSLSQGTYPLVVVDGVPIATGDLGGYADVNSLGDINPADIESIEILKDGAATAIYGSRAANGVMLITTKRGQKGQMKTTYSNYLGYSQPTRLFDLLNASEFELIANEKRTNAKRTPLAFNSGPNGAVDTDWQDAVLRNAFQQDHNLSLSGGTNATNYFFSLGYTDQQGVTRPNEMNRFALRANLDQTVTKWLSFGATAGVNRTAYDGLNRGENSLSGNIFSAIRQLPNTPVFNTAHPTGYNIDFDSPTLVGKWNNASTIGDNLPNIRYVVDNNRLTSNILRTIANAYGMITFTPGLTFRTQIGADVAQTEGLLYWNPSHGDGYSTKGRVQNTFTDFTRWNLQNVLSYLATFGTVHNLNLTLVNEIQKDRVSNFFSVGTDLANEFFKYNLISNSYGTANSGGGLSENGFLSFAGRMSYNFDNKYFIQASLRNDAISSMPEANRWGLFPGVSVGWTLSREPFMAGLKNLNDLKLRASWAVVGNTSVGNYPYAGLYGAAKYGDLNGIAFAQMGNDQLKWETSTKLDVGFDALFYDGRFRFVLDWFKNNQDHLILFVPTPPSLGIPGGGYNANIGSLVNTGIEAQTDINLIRTDRFVWNFNANFSHVTNEITKLVQEGLPIFPDNYVIIKEGESMRSIYGYDYVGVNSANGYPIYRKADGSMVQGVIESSNYKVYDPANPGDISKAASLSASEDKKIFGPSLPTWFGSFGSNFAFSGFDLGVMFRYSGGNYIMNRTRDDLVGQAFTNNSREILGRWQSPETPGDGWTPKLYDQATNFINLSNQTNGRFVEKADFLKLQNLVLGYTIPKSIVGRVGLDQARIFVQGQELFMLTPYTGIDPEMEVGGVDFNGTPRQRSITFGVNLSL